MRGLSEIRTAGFDAVVRPDRDVHFLREIAVVVADQEDVIAVLVVVPALVGAGDAAAELAAWFTGKLDALRKQRGAARGRACKQAQPRDGRSSHVGLLFYCCVFDSGFTPLVTPSPYFATRSAYSASLR